MKKYLLLLLFMNVIALYSVGLPHAVYFQVYSMENGKVTYPDSIQFTSWITDREDEVLTEKSFGCGFYKDKSLAAVQVGNFKTPWKAGEILNIEVKSNLGYGFRSIELDNSSAQYFILNYNGDDGLKLRKGEKSKSKKIKITPATFKDSVKIETDNSKTAELSILRNGKPYKKIKLNKNSVILDTKEFPPGVYIFEIKTGDVVYKKKLIKI